MTISLEIHYFNFRDVYELHIISTSNDGVCHAYYIQITKRQADDLTTIFGIPVR